MGRFFARHAVGDPFFVKNLENIQGDERDVIFLSIGFGKDSNGRLHVAFGVVLNSEGGWRRLNVLVTRASAALSSAPFVPTTSISARRRPAAWSL